MKRPISHTERGVSLVEVLVASAILLIALVPMVQIFLYAMRTASRADKMTQLTNLARDMSEEIRSQYFTDELARYNETTYAGIFAEETALSSFGLETGESNTTPAYTTANGGRIAIFNDVDDYDGWCRGVNCSTPAPLETYDGIVYSSANGFPPYVGYTQQVKVRNVWALSSEQIVKTPFLSGGLADQMTFKRYTFENWSAYRINPDTSSRFLGKDATGRSLLKIIEVTMTYDGPGNEHLEVKDVSLAIRPASVPGGMAGF